MKWTNDEWVKNNPQMSKYKKINNKIQVSKLNSWENFKKFNRLVIWIKAITLFSLVIECAAP